MAANPAPVAAAAAGRIRTPAEQSALDRLAALDGQDGAARRDNVVALIRDNGLPHRRVEAWKYTDLRTLLGEIPPAALRPAEAAAKDAVDKVVPLVDAARLPVVDGWAMPALADPLPDGFDLGEAVAGGETVADPADAIGLFHQAFGRPGFALALAAGAAPDRAVALVHTVTGGGPVLAAAGHAIDIGAGASATLIDHAAGPHGVPGLANARHTLRLGEGARLHWVIVQEEGDAARHLAQLNVRLAGDARLDLTVLNAGGALVRREVRVDVAGPGAQLAIRGVNLIGGGAHVDVTTILNHEAPETTARETFRNIVTGNGTGVFQGRINVAQKAQKTDAQMACNTLLLSDRADFSAKPELEIFADDVICGHGATCGQIDGEVLFFLRSRGIPADVAEKMMVLAFLAEVADDIADEPVRAALEARIRAWIGLPPDDGEDDDG